MSSAEIFCPGAMVVGSSPGGNCLGRCAALEGDAVGAEDMVEALGEVVDVMDVREGRLEAEVEEEVGESPGLGCRLKGLRILNCSSVLLLLM